MYTMPSYFKKVFTYCVLLSFTFLPLQFFEEKGEEKVWFPFYVPWNYCKGSQLDFSFLLDAPAGKHGFVTVKNGHFYFEDGTRARFWGLNLHSDKVCFPTKSQAEDIAKRLGQLGCNIVRMHFLDYQAPHGIVDSNRSDSQHFSDSQMDKLDYFIYQLKKNGIYITFDVLGVGVRRFKAGDEVVDYDKIKLGAGGISFFNENVIKLSRKFALDFLSHVNPYTGTRYLDEPAIAMVEMTNENSLFTRWITDKFTTYYEREINQLWKKWLEDRDSDSRPKHENWYDDVEFKFELQDRYQKKMYGYLRSIGVKCPIGASNIPHNNLTLMADGSMDFTDIHPYWELYDRLDRIHNRPLIMQHHLNPHTIINAMSIAKVCKRPLILTEWGGNWPNDWRAVDMLTTASYAALNDVDALFLYAYNGGWSMSWDNLEKRLYYGTVVFNDPAKMGLFSVAGLIFLRRDVRPSLNLYKVSYNRDNLFNMKELYDDSSKLAGIAYRSRLEKDFYEDKDTTSAPGETEYPDIKDFSIKNKKVVSDSGEIERDSEKGIFILKTPRTFSFSGFLKREKEYEFNGVKFQTESDFATFTITSLDGGPIVDSSRLLLAVVGRVRNKGQSFTPHITKEHDDVSRDVYILDEGTEPILVERIEGKIFLRKNKEEKGIRVFSLDERGFRESKIPVHFDNGVYSFDIGARSKTIYYEIIRR